MSAACAGIILCEGNENGLDCLLLRKILGDQIRIVPVGSRFGMKHRVDTVRKILHQPVFAILDRDFPQNWESPKNSPVVWRGLENGSETLFGWFWERKELENYLLDPTVIKMILSDSNLGENGYDAALKAAGDAIGGYQAARIALSVLGRSGQYYVPSTFGTKRGSDEHYRFPDGDSLKETACSAWLREINADYRQSHSKRFELLPELFQRYKLECLPGGERYRDFLNAFSGKDIGWYLDAWFQNNGFKGTRHFFACMKRGIENSDIDLATILPEWAELKHAVQTVLT